MTFYTRNLDICRFWYPKEILEPIHYGYRGMPVYIKGDHRAFNLMRVTAFKLIAPRVICQHGTAIIKACKAPWSVNHGGEIRSERAAFLYAITVDQSYFPSRKEEKAVLNTGTGAALAEAGPKMWAVHTEVCFKCKTYDKFISL